MSSIPITAPSLRARLAFGFICVWFISLTLLYARALPLFEATDEGAHFLYVHHVLETGTLPVLSGRLATAGDAPLIERWSFERHQPPLYYLISALLVSWSQRDDIEQYLQPNLLIFLRGVVAENHNMWLHAPASSGDTAAAAWTLRAFSVILGIITLLFVYQAAKLAFGQTEIALLAAAFVANIPMFVSLSGSINNDNLLGALFAAGVYWCLRLWQRQDITRLDVGVVSLLLACAALTKLTGVTLFGIVYLSLLMGVYQKRYPWRKAAVLVGVSLGGAALLAGWWYVRNVTLYGDVLASQATILFFSETPERRSSEAILSEIPRMWKTFWFGIGYLHNLVFAPDWFYAYAGLISVAAGAGLALLWRRSSEKRWTLLFQLVIVGVLVAALLAGTRQIDISYGRIIFPSLAALAPLAAASWVALLGKWGSALVVVLLAVGAVVFPLRDLPLAYPRLTAVRDVPAGATPLNARAESLALLGYEVENTRLFPGETARLWLYLRGQHPDNPALSVKALDPVNTQILGTTEIYPGMTATAQLDAQTLYRVPVEVPVSAPDDPNPRQIQFSLAWLNPVNGQIVAWDDVPLLYGPVLMSPHRPPPLDTVSDVVFGDVIRLAGHSSAEHTLRPGERLVVQTQWAYAGHTSTAWTMALGLLDEQNKVLVNADGAPLFYPTTLWQPDALYTDSRVLVLPEDTLPGVYRLYIGWYRLDDGQRLSPSGRHVEGDLYFAPGAVRVTGP